MRQILLIARQLSVAGASIDPQTAKFIDTQKDLHQDISAELASYGHVLKQVTSGVFPRANTPAPDMRPLERALEEQAPEESRSTPNYFTQIIPLIHKSDCVVVIRDGENDLRGAVVMYASMHNKRVLALQREPHGMHLPGNPLYEMPSITNIRFHSFTEAKNGIVRFMNGIPRRFAAG